MMMFLLLLISDSAFIVGFVAALFTGNRYDWPYSLICWGATTTVASLLFLWLV